MLTQIILHLLNTNQFLLVPFQMVGKNGIKLAVPLKYLSIFWRSLEMPLINFKVEPLLSWKKTVYCLVLLMIQLLK